eukprot:gene904-9814_t
MSEVRIFSCLLLLLFVALVSSQNILSELTVENICFGKNSSDFNVCSGAGNCVASNRCNCETGRDGSECQYTFDINDTPKVFSFGINESGELADGNTSTNRSTPYQVQKENYMIKKLCPGFSQFFVIKNYSEAFGVGNNIKSHLGVGNASNNYNFVTTFSSIFNQKQEVEEVQGGEYHSILLTTSGHVYSIGDNEYGQLGVGTKIAISRSYIKANVSNIKQISTFRYHNLLLNSSGSVYAYGYGEYGELGQGDETIRFVPTLVPNFNNVKQVAAGDFFSLMLLETGMVYGMGRNFFGALGDGTKISRTTPVPIALENSNIVYIAAGGGHSMILKSDGKAYSFGDNSLGQVGVNTATKFITVPTAVVGDNSKIVKISLGGAHSLFLKSNGKVYGLGSNRYGQITGPLAMKGNKYLTELVSTDNFGVLDIAASGDASMFLKSNSTCFGKTNSNSSICSGNGICISYNKCKCYFGSSGNECEITQPSPVPSPVPNASPKPSPAVSTVPPMVSPTNSPIASPMKSTAPKTSAMPRSSPMSSVVPATSVLPTPSQPKMSTLPSNSKMPTGSPSPNPSISPRTTIRSTQSPSSSKTPTKSTTVSGASTKVVSLFVVFSFIIYFI